MYSNVQKFYNYHVTDMQTFIKRNIRCACLIVVKKDIAPQYIDKQKRVCWIKVTIFALLSLSCWL